MEIGPTSFARLIYGTVGISAFSGRLAPLKGLVSRVRSPQEGQKILMLDSVNLRILPCFACLAVVILAW